MVRMKPRTTTSGGVKFACYLESLKPNSGALRLIPRSHQSPLHGQRYPGIRLGIGVYQRYRVQQPKVACFMRGEGSMTAMYYKNASDEKEEAP